MAIRFAVAFVAAYLPFATGSSSRRLIPAKAGLSLSLLAGASAMACDKGSECVQECHVCDQVAYNYDGESSEYVEVKGLVRGVFEDGQCLLQLSAQSAEQIGRDAVVMRPECLWRDNSEDADFKSRPSRFWDDAIPLLEKANNKFGFKRLNSLKRKKKRKWCHNSGRNQWNLW